MKSIIIGDSDPWARLANGIIYQAANDYRVALKREKQLRRKARKKATELMGVQAERESLEQFFYSQWYGTLTSVEPDMILEHIRKEVDYDGKRIPAPGLSA